MLLKIRQATAYGANFMMMSMIFDVIAKTDSMTPTNGADTGAGISVIAMPMIKAKNMMCSMFGLVPEIELNTLLGTTVFTACINGESDFAASAACFWAAVAVVAPPLNFSFNCTATSGLMRSPGRIVLARTRPMITEIAEMIRQ